MSCRCPLQFAHPGPELGLKRFDFVDGQLQGIMGAFQPLDLLGADLAHQVDSIIHDVAGFVVVAWGALFVDVQRLEAQLGAGCNRPVVPGVILTIVMATATDARLIRVTQADELVEGLLSLAQVIRLALQPLLPYLDLPPLAVSDGLPRRLGVLVLDGQGACRRADALPEALRDERGAALRVLALAGLGLAGGKRHAVTLGSTRIKTGPPMNQVECCPHLPHVRRSCI